MAVFAVIATINAPAVLSTAERVYGVNYLKLTDSTCLVSDGGTSMSVSQRLGLVTDGLFPAPGSALIVSAGDYWGISDPSTWQWIQSRWANGLRNVFG